MFPRNGIRIPSRQCRRAVVAKLPSEYSLVIPVLLWSVFPQRSEVFTTEQVTFYRFLLCLLGSESAAERLSLFADSG